MIKSAVDDLKKSGAPMSLTLPPGGGGSPSSPSPYVCVSVCVLAHLFKEQDIFIACQSSPISKYLISFVIFSLSG